MHSRTRASPAYLAILCWHHYNCLKLLLTYGPFYKNMTTCGPLPIKWSMK